MSTARNRFARGGLGADAGRPGIASEHEGEIPELSGDHASTGSSQPSELLVNLLAGRGGEEIHTVVVASVSELTSAATTSEEVASSASSAGLTCMLAALERDANASTLTTRGRFTPATVDPSLPASALLETPLRVDLTRTVVPEGLEAWLEAARACGDLVLIAGPPLLTSFDAGLLARWCDGLILVVDGGATSRDDLQLAAERARATQATVLGVVWQETNVVVPLWQRVLNGLRGRLAGRR